MNKQFCLLLTKLSSMAKITYQFYYFPILNVNIYKINAGFFFKKAKI